MQGPGHVDLREPLVELHEPRDDADGTDAQAPRGHPQRVWVRELFNRIEDPRVLQRFAHAHKRDRINLLSGFHKKTTASISVEDRNTIIQNP